MKKNRQLKNIVLTVIVLLGTVSNVCAQGSNDMNQESQFEKLYSEMYQAMIAKDTVGLGNMLDESFVLVHMTGMRQSKQEYLSAIENGTLNYYSCEETVIEKNRESGNEDRMHIIGKSRVNAAVFSGGRRTWPLQLDIDLVKKGNEWKITEIKASTY